MGDSRGHWDGDTLVVDVANNNDKTWFDMAGDFHSGALHVVERYRMTDHDTIQYEATIEDPKVFTKPWTINIPLHRRTDRTRLFEYVCEAELEESNGAFTREPRTWYPGSPDAPAVKMEASTWVPPAVPAVPNLRRMPDGKPDLNGFYESTSRGANQGLERRNRGRGGARSPRSVSYRRSGGRHAPDAALGGCGTYEPQPSRTRLRRCHGSLFPAWRAARDVDPRGLPDYPDAGLHCVLPRTRSLANHIARRAPAPARFDAAYGTAIRWDIGKATRL